MWILSVKSLEKSWFLQKADETEKLFMLLYNMEWC